MSEDKKEVEETTEEETLETNNYTELDDDQSDESQEQIESEEDEQSEDEGEVDYKSELERLQGEIAQKNERIAKQDKKIIKLKQRSKDDEQDEEEEEDEDTRIQKKVEEQMTSFVEDTIEEEIEKVASNEDEKKLIRWYFDNRIVKDGWSKKAIVDYVSDAKALANKGKLATKSKMLDKSAKSKETAGKPNFSGTPPKKSTMKVTEYDKKMATKYFKGDLKKWMKYKS